VEKFWTKERQSVSGKGNTTIINKKIFCGNISIDTVHIISSINIFHNIELDKVILCINRQLGNDN